VHAQTRRVDLDELCTSRTRRNGPSRRRCGRNGDELSAADRSIDALIAEGWLAGPQWSAVGDFSIDGRRLGAEPYRHTSKSRHETRLVQDQSETFLVAHALANVGYRHVALRKGERPDFVGTFVDGVQVGVEVAELVEPQSARWRNAVENVRVGVRDMVDSDPALRAALAGRLLSVALWRCPSRVAEFRLKREIAQYVLLGPSTTRAGNRITDPRFPELTAHWAHVYSFESKLGHLDVTGPANAFDSRAMVEVALKVLERKRRCAAGYDATFPLWLVLVVTDLMGIYGDSLDVLERLAPAIHPFERVIIYDQNRLVIWMPKGLRRPA
jgi:hypothetical protein